MDQRIAAALRALQLLILGVAYYVWYEIHLSPSYFRYQTWVMLLSVLWNLYALCYLVGICDMLKDDPTRFRAAIMSILDWTMACLVFASFVYTAVTYSLFVWIWHDCSYLASNCLLVGIFALIHMVHSLIYVVTAVDFTRTWSK